MPDTATPSRPRYVCAACRGAGCLVHRLITLHAAEDTVMVCAGAWQGLPEWMRSSFKLLEEKKGKNLTKRREIVQEIVDHLKTA